MPFKGHQRGQRIWRKKDQQEMKRRLVRLRRALTQWPGSKSSFGCLKWTTPCRTNIDLLTRYRYSFVLSEEGRRAAWSLWRINVGIGWQVALREVLVWRNALSRCAGYCPYHEVVQIPAGAVLKPLSTRGFDSLDKRLTKAITVTNRWTVWSVSATWTTWKKAS